MSKNRKGKRITVKTYATINPGPIRFGSLTRKLMGWDKKKCLNCGAEVE